METQLKQFVKKAAFKKRESLREHTEKEKKKVAEEVKAFHEEHAALLASQVSQSPHANTHIYLCTHCLVFAAKTFASFVQVDLFLFTSLAPLSRRVTHTLTHSLTHVLSYICYTRTHTHRCAFVNGRRTRTIAKRWLR